MRSGTELTAVKKYQEGPLAECFHNLTACRCVCVGWGGSSKLEMQTVKEAHVLINGQFQVKPQI